jgi:ATP-dependent Zn protease
MDGIDSGKGDAPILLMGATNRVQVLDPALLRPGRFDRIVEVPPPDEAGRLSVLHVHLEGVKLHPDVRVDSYARETRAFTGADLANVVVRVCGAPVKSSVHFLFLCGGASVERGCDDCCSHAKRSRG